MAKHSSHHRSAALRARLAVISAITLGLLRISAAATQATTADSSTSSLQAAASGSLPRKGLFNLGKVAVLPESYLALLGPPLSGQAGETLQLPTLPTTDGVALSWRLRTSNYTVLSGDGVAIPLQAIAPGTYELELTVQYDGNYATGTCPLTVTGTGGATARSTADSEAMKAIVVSTLNSTGLPQLLSEGSTVHVAATSFTQVNSTAQQNATTAVTAAAVVAPAQPNATTAAAVVAPAQQTAATAAAVVAPAQQTAATAAGSKSPSPPKSTITTAVSRVSLAPNSAITSVGSSAQPAAKTKAKSKPPSNARMAASLAVKRPGFNEYRIVSSNKPVILTRKL